MCFDEIFKAASSSLADMMPGSHFHPVLGDGKITENGKVDTVVFCSGKHFYDLEKQRTKQGKSNVSIIRLEVKLFFDALKCQPFLMIFFIFGFSASVDIRPLPGVWVAKLVGVVLGVQDR